MHSDDNQPIGKKLTPNDKLNECHFWHIYLLSYLFIYLFLILAVWVLHSLSSSSDWCHLQILWILWMKLHRHKQRNAVKEDLHLHSVGGRFIFKRVNPDFWWQFSLLVGFSLSSFWGVCVSEAFCGCVDGQIFQTDFLVIRHLSDQQTSLLTIWPLLEQLMLISFS